MPRLTRSILAYRKHRASGQVVVTLGYRNFYLGPYGTKVSRNEYDRTVDANSSLRLLQATFLLHTHFRQSPRLRLL